MYRSFLIITLLLTITPLSHSAPFSTSNLKEDPFSSEPLESEQKVKPLRELDIAKSEQQRGIIRDLAARHLGKSISKTKNNDLAVLQQLLDKRLIDKTDRFTLQAMGVILGDILVVEQHLEWVLYKDSIGNTRALAKNLSSNDVIFPITMISRRVEVGVNVKVIDVYNKAIVAAQGI